MTWLSCALAAQGEELPAISRFQAVALGSKIYIHTHRSLQDILVLDVANPDEPVLSLLPVTSEDDPPMSRCASVLHVCPLWAATCGSLHMAGALASIFPAPRLEVAPCCCM